MLDFIIKSIFIIFDKYKIFIFIKKNLKTSFFFDKNCLKNDSFELYIKKDNVMRKLISFFKKILNFN